MRYFLVIFFVMLFCVQSHAQDKPATLVTMLDAYEKTLNIRFSYDPAMIELVDFSFDKKDSFEAFQAKIEANLPFQIQSIDEQYYTLSTITTTYSLQVTDSLNQEHISPSDLIVLVNGQPIPQKLSEPAVLFKYKPTISDTLTLYTVGYNQKHLPLADLLNQRKLTTTLSAPVVKLSEVTIHDYMTRGIDLNPSSQSIGIAVRNLPLLPGETDGDIFASITALPGVTTPDGRAGNLFVRGSDTDQTLILFDNIPIYHRGHYFGTISPYNPKIVDNVEVYRGGFHPRLGERVGGAILINSESAPTSKPTVGAGANTLFGMGYAKVPLVKNKLGISIGARHSYPTGFQSPKLKAISESVYGGTGLVDSNGNITGIVKVTFEDYHGKVNYQINQRNKISLSGIFTKTKVLSQIETAQGSPPAPIEETITQNTGFNMEWTSILNPQWTSTSIATLSDYTYSYQTQTPKQNVLGFNAINELRDINVRQEFAYKDRQPLSAQFGIDYKWQSVNIESQTVPTGDSVKLSIATYRYSNSLSPFANFEYSGWKKWYFQLGIRGTYYELLNTYRVTPRILVNYDATDWLTFKASTGLYNQYLSQVKNLEFSGGGFDNEVWTLADGENGYIINGSQSTLGGIFHKGDWIFDVEAFSKTADDITTYSDIRFSRKGEFLTMDQWVYGIDLLLKKQMSDATSLWAGYSYTESTLSLDTTDVTTYSSKYVQPHVWYLGGAFNKKNWKVSAAWKYASGLNAQSLDLIRSELLFEQNQANSPPAQSNPFTNREERYPYMHQVDLSASYTLPKTDRRKWSASFGLSLLNVFDQKILIDQVFRGANGGFQDRYAPGFSPNLMVIVEW